MQKDKIISALIGLVGACNNNPKTENTDRLVIKALASASDPDAVNDTVSEIRKEKGIAKQRKVYSMASRDRFH